MHHVICYWIGPPWIKYDSIIICCYIVFLMYPYYHLHRVFKAIYQLSTVLLYVVLH